MTPQDIVVEALLTAGSSPDGCIFAASDYGEPDHHTPEFAAALLAASPTLAAALDQYVALERLPDEVSRRYHAIHHDREHEWSPIMSCACGPIGRYLAGQGTLDHLYWPSDEGNAWQPAIDAATASDR